MGISVATHGDLKCAMFHKGGVLYESCVGYGRKNNCWLCRVDNIQLAELKPNGEK